MAKEYNEIYLGSLLQRNIFGLRRRNNELIELTNFVAALGASETTKYIWLVITTKYIWPQTA